VYQLKGLRSALDVDLNELLLVLGLDAHSVRGSPLTVDNGTCYGSQ